MLITVFEFLFFIAAQYSINFLRTLNSFAVVVPALPVLGYAYWKFGVAITIIIWLSIRRANLADYGFRNFGPIWLFLLVVLGMILVSILLPSLLKPVLAPYFHGGENLSRFAPLVGNRPMLLWVLPGVWVFAAFGEEVFYRGFVLESLRRIFGGGRVAMILAVLFQGALFGAAHYYQGPVGMITIGLGGVVSGCLFWAGGRRLWPLIVAHGIVDSIGMWAIYAGWMSV